LALRKNHARTRHGIWMAASVKFLVPFSVLVGLGSQVEWRAAPAASASALPMAVEGIGRPIAPAMPVAAAEAGSFSVTALLWMVWLGGFAAVMGFWWLRWRRVCAAVRASEPVAAGREAEFLRELQQAARVPAGIRLAASAGSLEPGVFGIFRPVLLLPAGMAERLGDAQLKAILAHELCHVRRRDNLAAAVHMVVEALFWFHPLVWWLGARLVAERERACDEEVLRLGSEPEAYAEGILQVCRFCLESPLACVSGITGSSLKKRIEEVMSSRGAHELNGARRFLLGAAGVAAVAVPVAIGVWNAPAGRAQAQAEGGEKPRFEVASIKPSATGGGRMFVRLMFLPGGRFDANNVSLKMLIRSAYGVQDFQISGLPDSVGSLRYDISAKPDHPFGGDPRKMNEEQRKAFAEQIKLRIQSLLADRFQLKFHRETKDLPIYALVVAKNGPKLQESKPGEGEGEGQRFRGMRVERGTVEAHGATLQFLAQHLSSELGRTVQDDTGLKGSYDFKLQWTPEPGQSMTPGMPAPKEAPATESGPSLFTALREQLGLKLESRKGPVEMLVIDHVEKASEN
jgi:bla regulator protein blaR1